ncbi:MAG: ATP-binding protein [Syntrophorhabdaceae bacterium]|nr:ATP-binding protein [Syntrophorhabdaceae bacterium]
MGHELTKDTIDFHAVVNSLTDGIIVIDSARRVVFWNPAAEKMLGLNEKTEGSREIRDVIQYRPLSNIIEKGFGPETSQYSIISEEVEIDYPSERTLMVDVLRVKDEKAQDYGIVSILRDITTLKSIGKIKSQFVAMVTHELRAPLSAVEGYLSAFINQSAGNDPQMYLEMMKRARQRTKALLQLIEDLLHYSRLEAKSPPRKREMLNIPELISNTVEMLKCQSRSKDIKFKIDIDHSMPLFEADRQEMEQLLTNLITNAIKYNKKDGKVFIKAYTDKKNLCIVVQDTGIGINEEDLPYIFDEFFRASNAETRYITGTGLGLTIVKKIVDAYFGKITVESKVGKGTKFTVILPCKDKKGTN